MRAIIAIIIIVALAGTAYAATELTDPVAINNIGYYAYERGEYDLAQRLFQTAIANDPNYLKARENLAVLFHEQGMYDEAANELQALTRLEEDNAQYWYDLGVNLIANFRFGTRQIEDFHAGIRAYENAAQLNQDYAQVQENLAVLYAIKEEFQI